MENCSKEITKLWAFQFRVGGQALRIVLFRALRGRSIVCIQRKVESDPQFLSGAPVESFDNNNFGD